MDDFKEFRISWTECPTAYRSPQVLFVKALSVIDAEVIARRHIERTYHIEWFKINSIKEVQPVPAGEVVSA